MKKIIALMAALTMCMGISAHAAGQTKVIVTDGNENEISFVNDTTDKDAKSIKKVLNTLEGLDDNGAQINQAFEVSCEVEGDALTDIFLRLEADKDDVFDVYEIELKDAADEVVFDSNETELEIKEEDDKYVADIFLGRYNVNELYELNTYNLSVTVAKDAKKADIKDAMDIDWAIVSDPVEDGSTPTPDEIEKTTPAPTATPKATAAPTTAPTATPSAEATPEATEATEAPVEEVSSGERMIGTDDGEIKPGKYTATARDKKATLKIYDEDGELARTIELNEENPSKVITLSEGQKIAYEGGVNLTPSSSKSTSSTGTIAGNTSSTKSNTSSTKTNPKTGDSSPIAGVAMIGVFALGMLAYPGIEKRRKNN